MRKHVLAGTLAAAVAASVTGLPLGQEAWYGTPRWYAARPYAWAIAAEVAVVAGLPDAAERLAAAAPAGEENYWAAACLAAPRAVSTATTGRWPGRWPGGRPSTPGSNVPAR
jgi:hypothetical protein